MEILLMICIFSVSAAICLYSFVTANNISKQRSELDASVLLAQDTCEVLKHARGDVEAVADLTDGEVTDYGIVIYRDENGDTVSQDSAIFVVTVTMLDSGNGVGNAKVSVSVSTRTVYELNVAWQEIS